jgi:hypothetical protein
MRNTQQQKQGKPDTFQSLEHQIKMIPFHYYPTPKKNVFPNSPISVTLIQKK